MRFLLIITPALVLCGPVAALEITGNVVVGNYLAYEDIIISPIGSFEAHDIQAMDSLYILNYGQFIGGINVAENLSVEIRNVGVFDANVSCQNGARFIQVITSNADITNLGLSGGFDVSVRDGIGLNFNALMAVASNADAIEIINTDFNDVSFDGFVAPSDVTLGGYVILRFDDITNQPVLLFSNVTGDGVVHVESNALDVLHIYQTYRVNDDIFVRFVRSTDYARILNNGVGDFLNDLRLSGRDDNLFSKLDTAESVDEINDILSHSFRTSPIELMRPIRIMNLHKNLETMHIDDDVLFEIEPLIIYSTDVFMSGVRPSVSFSIDDLHLKLSGYVMAMNYSDDINKYSGLSFDTSIDAQYDLFDNNFVRAHVGGGKSYFDVGPVFSDGSVVNNPDGTSGYAIGEYGHVFNLPGGYKVSPFVGVGSEYLAIANANDVNIYGIGGTDVGYEYEFDGLRYSYAVRVIARTDTAYGVGTDLSIWSIMDAAGADLHIDTVYNDDFCLSFKVSLNGRFIF